MWTIQRRRDAVRWLRSAAMHQVLNTLAAGTALCLLVFAGCSGGALSEQPKRSATAPAFAATPSSVGAVVTVPLAELAALLNARIPNQFSDSGNGNDVCVQHLWKDCAGTKYEFTARKDGDVKVSAADSRTLRLQGAIKFSGKGGFRGDVAKAIKADAKSFEGTVVITVDVRLDVDDRWCPTTDVEVGYSWSRVPRVEIVDGIWVNIENQVGEPIDSALAGLENEIETALDCSLLRPQLEKVYRSYSFAVGLPTGTNAYVNISPRGLGFSGLTYSAADARFAAAVEADVELADRPVEEASLPLPAPERIADPDASTVHLAVPIRAGYERLERELVAALGDRRYAAATAAGELTVMVTGIQVYPSGDRLVLGIDVDADLPTRLLDTRGTVYLLGRPVVEGDTLKIEDLDFTRRLDNDFWNVATALFEHDILGALRNAATLDLGEGVAASKSAIERAVDEAKEGQGVAVTLEDVTLDLGRVVPGETELVVEGLMSARASLAVKPTGVLSAGL